MTQPAVVVDHLVPMVGVDCVIRSPKPQDNLPHHLEQDLRVGQIGPRFGPLLPPVNEHPWVFVMTQAALVVDHLVPMVGVDDVIRSRKPKDNLTHHLEKDLCVGQIGPRFGPLLPPVKEHPWVFEIGRAHV